MIITLTGENTFGIAAAERQIVEAFTAKHGANGVERLDAEELTLQRLPDLLQGATLFAPARLVVLKNLASNKPMLEPLTEGLVKAAGETTVVIADAALDRRTKLYKFLKAHGTFKEFSQLSDGQLTQWLQAEATRLGGALDAPTARHLLERAGRDQWALTHELEKLVAYQPRIDNAAVNLLVEPAAEGTAFELLDAALAGKTGETTRLIAALKTQEDPYKLFGLLASQVHTLAVIATAGTRSPDTIAKEVGLHPFVVRKTQAVAKRLGAVGVRQIAADVALCDAQLKSTGADPWDLLQLCVQKIARLA